MTPIRFLTKDLEDCHLLDPDFDGGFLGMITVKRRSDLTGKVSSRELDITENQYTDFMRRRREGTTDLIQNEFPDLSLDDREFIKTGATPEEWDRLIPDV